MRRTNVIPSFAASPGPAVLVRTIIFMLSSLFLGSCARGTAVDGEKPVTHEQFASQLQATGLAQTTMGRRWLDSARDALVNPLEIVPPYAESGGFVAQQAGALGLAFDGYEGQTLNLHFQRRGEPGGQVFVELFEVRERAGERRHMPLRALAPEESRMQVKLSDDGRYLLRLQPAPLVDALYDLRIELDAAMPFPVDDSGAGVGSFFGDPRDAGARQHEGVDIFMPRNTPAIAVASGRATPRTTPRGGNVVWLRTKGVSYYYAHLEKAAFSRAREVEAGEVLGYIGNSGNARTTPPHLHFGIYRRGHGAVDPLPRMVARLFEGPAPEVTFEPRYVRTSAGILNLRDAPGTSADIIGQLDAGTLVQASALRGDWLRVRTPDNGSGWIHSSYQEDAALEAYWQPQATGWLLDAVSADARPVDVVEADDEFEVLGRHGTHLLVRSPGSAVAGWVELSPDEPGAGASVQASDNNEPGQVGVTSGAGS